MKVEWADITSRFSNGKPLEMIQYRAEVGPFALWVREDGLWEIGVQIDNGDGSSWFPPSGDAPTLEDAKKAAESGLWEYVRRIVEAAT